MSKTIRGTLFEQSRLEQRDSASLKKSLVQLRQKFVRKIQKSDKNLGRYGGESAPSLWKKYSTLAAGLRGSQKIVQEERSHLGLGNDLPLKGSTPCIYPASSEFLGVLSAERDLAELRGADSNRPVLAISKDRLGHQGPAGLSRG